MRYIVMDWTGNRIIKEFYVEIGKFLFLSVLLLSACQQDASDNVIGRVYGAEHEYIAIGEDTYTACYDSGYHATDRNEVLGCVKFENKDTDPMIVYSIKNVENNEYIYTLWVYDGCIYKKDAK